MDLRVGKTNETLNAEQIEQFKQVLLQRLVAFPNGQANGQPRWFLTPITEGNVAYIYYDENPLLTISFDGQRVAFTGNKGTPRLDEITYAIRRLAVEFGFLVWSGAHGMARLPRDYRLEMEHPIFERAENLRTSLERTPFKPLFGQFRYFSNTGEIALDEPQYFLHKETGAVHIMNMPLLRFLWSKNTHEDSEELSYEVAKNMHEFAAKDDLNLIPRSFYRYYKKPFKIINATDFNVEQVSRKVFIDPQVYNFSDDVNTILANRENGLHFMDKIRQNESLEQALKRILREELKVGEDFVGARIYGIEFDRDKEERLTPRLKINVYIEGLADMLSARPYDWVPLKDANSGAASPQIPGQQPPPGAPPPAPAAT